ncbi:MAG: LPS export ABC transporter permease LptG [Rhodospirillum sp.]|nr:LPS export ABC transporter permease LptG [Rhodospirillum sp.]MCF8489989.1 LPS export ABC transporter permease LptG [Rhodospirillum sp.]MCF8501517.1 LPS export ABC transporter permease LptG [Rhodospirillum sp.]
MRLYSTLLMYIGRSYLKALLGATLIVSSLLFLFDIIEITRRTGSKSIGIDLVMEMALYRLPLSLQAAFPFVFMGGAVLIFWKFARSSELVVFRSIGMSVWRFLSPILVIVVVLGIANVTLFNPLASGLYSEFEQMEADLETSVNSPLAFDDGGLWLREKRDDGQVVMHAEQVRQVESALRMQGVTIFRLGLDGRFQERVDASAAGLEKGNLLLSDAVVTKPGRLGVHFNTLVEPSNLTLPKIRDSFSPPETVSFWDLPDFIRFFDAAGFSSHAHRLQWHALLASPLLLVAMVLMGAVFSLKPSQRSVNWLFRIVGAVAAGFGVFFFSKITFTLGLAETLPVSMAAWSPTLVTTFVALAILFHLEDG